MYGYMVPTALGERILLDRDVKSHPTNPKGKQCFFDKVIGCAGH